VSGRPEAEEDMKQAQPENCERSGGNAVTGIREGEDRKETRLPTER